jgi:hypothetical protein
MPLRSRVLRSLLLLAAFIAAAPRPARPQERHPLDIPDPAQTSQPQRTHLILKDGSYQLVLSYKVHGQVVRYVSAERNGAKEEVPLALVDLPATERWQREHQPGADRSDHAVLSPELAREEADRAALTPEIAPDLRLPEEDAMLALDTFAGTPELVPLPQQNSDLNHETAHAVQKIAVNPASSAHRIGDLRGVRADVQLHVNDPAFYVRIGDDAAGDTGGAITVDTGGASGRDTPGAGADNHDYVIERIDVRYDGRRIDSFHLWQLGAGKPQPDIIEVKAQPLPGGHWLKLTPTQPLEIGEYALIELLSDHEVNLDVWDFGIHPTAQENVEAQHPKPRRPATLERR